MKLILMMVFTGFLQAEKVRVFLGSGDSGIFRAEFDEATGEIHDLKNVSQDSGTGFLTRRGEALYSVGRVKGEGFVYGYQIGVGGALRRVSAQPSLGKGPCMVSLDKTGGVLMVANYGSGSVASYLCDRGVIEAGFSHQHAGSSVVDGRQEGPHAHSIYAGPQNRYVYAADLGTDEVVVYALEVETGKLRRQGAAKVPPGSGPRHMKLSRDGKRLFVLNELTLTVSVFLREKEGGLRLERTVSVLNEGESKEKMSGSEILVSGDGRFLYTANRDLTKEGRDSVSVLSVSAEGELELLEVLKVGVRIPRHINLSPSGGWLLVAGQVSNEVAVLKVKENGLLETTEKRFALQKAMCICF